MPQDGSQDAPRGPKNSPRRLKVAKEPEEAKILPKPKEVTCVLLSRLFASGGNSRPQDGSKMAQEGPKRGPREPQDGPKSAQERSKSAPRARQEAILELLRGEAN